LELGGRPNFKVPYNGGMPKENIMGTKHKQKRQPQDKLGYWLRKLPICREIVVSQMQECPPIVPELDVKYQIADTATMHLQANNIHLYSGRYLIGDNNERGTRFEYALAVDAKGKVISRLEWRRGTLGPNNTELYLKYIFGFGKKPEVITQIKEIYWVTIYHWYTAPTPTDTNPVEPNFGNTMKKIETHIIVFRKPRNKSFAELIEQAEREKEECETAYLRFPKKMPKYHGIEAALRAGCKMHAFSSGGGLRVVRLERAAKDGKRNINYPKLMGYGEHPHIEEALKQLNEDYLAGGRPYKKVYGKLYPHYLTGDTVSTSNIDWWIRKGSTFDCWFENGEVIFQLAGLIQTETPPLVLAAVETEGKTVRCSNRGYTYEASPYLFANGEIGSSSTVIEGPADQPNSDAWMYHINKTGHGQSFWEAMKAAFEAPEIEVTSN